ncbi:MAG: TolC family protein [Leptospiraceae bacterium]|nr:TolC family protein [Leptospiraceae bacterium]MCP5511341.1 TolC family protein [Leptospiraceae bacterium]
MKIEQNPLSPKSRIYPGLFLGLSWDGSRGLSSFFSMILIFLFTNLFILPDSLIAQEESQKNPNVLSIENAVKNVLENNLTVKNAKLEIIKADSGSLKNSSRFLWKIYGDASIFKSVNPLNASNIISGTKISQDKLSLGLEKDFETGTYIATEISTLRFDTNAFEGELGYIFPAFSSLALKPLYTGALSFRISQELWKHSFGKVNKNTDKLLRLKTVIDRDQLVFLLTNVVTKTLIDYWALSIQESAVNTFEKLVKNAVFIQNITLRKRRIGTAEQFEVNLWNSIVTKLKGQLEKAKVDRDLARRDLARVMALDSVDSFSAVTDLKAELPENLDFIKDYEYALENRIDLKNIRRMQEVSGYQLENAEEEDNPSMKVSALYSSRAQSLLSPQNNYLNTQNGISTFKYPEKRIEMELSYPLWDEGLKENIKSSKVDIAQWKQKQIDLEKEIENELRDRISAIKSSYSSLKIAEQNLIENEKYYNGISQKFAVGRFNASDVKTALDNLAQSELILVQSKVNFNINLIRYELAKNSLFQKYNIDPQKIVDEIVRQGEERMK